MKAEGYAHPKTGHENENTRAVERQIGYFFIEILKFLDEEAITL